MLKKLLEQGYGNDVKLNCAEKILYGGNEVYNLELDSEALKLASGFGGGMAIESTCGALTGGIMILGKLFHPKNGKEKENFKLMIKNFLDTYKKEMDDINCDALKNRYRTEEEGCKAVILKAAEILENTIKQENKKRNV